MNSRQRQEATKAPSPQSSHCSITASTTSPARGHPLAAWHGRLGNYGVQRLLQPKLMVSQPDDPLEQEADRVADQVLRMPVPAVHRACPTCTEGGASCPACAEDERPTIFRAAEEPSVAFAPAGLLSGLGTGRPLETSTRTFFEPRFGLDLGAVRVHTSERAAAAARDVRARAFTVGRDVVFGVGQYQPDTEAGRRLLAHELGHVLQQGSAARVAGSFGTESACAGRWIVQRRVAHPGLREATLQVRWADDDVHFYHRVIRAIAGSADFRGVETASLWQPFHDPIFRFHRRFSRRLLHIRTGDVVVLRVSAWFDPTVFHGQVTGASVQAEEEALLQQVRTPGAPSGAPPSVGEAVTLPATFPERGIRVVGSDAEGLRSILSSCTGMNLRISGGQMLEIGPGRAGAPRSRAARMALERFIRGTPVGVIIDTNPASEAVEVGAFSRTQPGYQRIDVANVRALAAATGEHAGLSACDAVMHEVAEAVAGRQASRTTTAAGEELYQISHAQGMQVEARIRAQLRLPPRLTLQEGNTVLMGRESATTLILLSSMVFARDAERFTQLSVVRFVLGPVRRGPGGTTQSGDYNVAGSHVVSGVERFSNTREAILVFNRYAGQFGFQPLPVPPP